MARLITRVDKTIVNYEGVFIYTIDASFNGIVGGIDSAYIKLFIPDTINFMAGDVQDPVKEIRTEVVEGGTNIIFDFRSIKDLGVAVRIGIGGQYKVEATNGSNYTAEPELWINGSLQVKDVVDSVKLVVNPRFEIRQEIVLPEVNPAPGGIVYYRVTLENFGDKGAGIEGVEIKIPEVEGMIIDPTYTPEGEDQSQGLFIDKSNNGRMASIANRTLTFTLERYRGNKYIFFYRINLDSELKVGSDIVTKCNWAIRGEEQEPYISTVILGQPIYSATINKYGPDYTLPGEHINYELYFTNDGNQNLNHTNIVDELSNNVKYLSFTTGSFRVININKKINGNYFIKYTTINGNSGKLGPFSTEVNSSIDLTKLIDIDDNLSSLIWELPIFGVGVRDKIPPHINGKVREGIAIGKTILNHFHLEWDTSGGQQSKFVNHTTLVQDLCMLIPVFKQISPNRPVKPGNIIRYQIGANCRRSRLSNPLIAMLLPKELEYVGNTQVKYSDYFREEIEPETPKIIVIENFRNTGQTLVKATYDGRYSYNFNQKATISIEFDTRVRIGATGTVKANMVLNTMDNTGVIASGYDVYEDILNIAEDKNISTEYVTSNVIRNQILFFVSTDCDKKVKGALDSQFVEEPQVGRTLEGGGVEYKILVTNIGNANLQSVDIIDILPHVGDHGVIEVNAARLSEFVVYSINEITATLVPKRPEQEQVEVEILYSKDYNPRRFGNAFQTIGMVDDWTSVLPDDATEIKSFRVRTKDTQIYPAQALEIKVYATVPVGVKTSQVAWNSFAANVTYFDLNGKLQHLLAMEPEKVGVEVLDLESGKGQIGGFAWVDEDGDGIYTNQGQGVNDIGVVLYDKTGRAIAATFTVPNNDGVPGYYLFNNLDKGKYFVKFFIDTIEYEFTAQRLDVSNGSKPNRTTGATPVVDLNKVLIQRNINVGIRLIDPLKFILEINKSARSMMRNVIYNQMLIEMKYEDLQELMK